MEKELITPGSGPRAIDYWSQAAAAIFKFVVYRADGSILDDSAVLCASMDPPGTFKILMGKKFKVEKWESFLKTMRQSEKARFDGSETDCTQYAHVSRMLRDISKGRQPHGCMGALASASGGHGHSHGPPDELAELIAAPEELTFEFTLLRVDKLDQHEEDVWAMDKEKQAESAPVFKEQGNAHFKKAEYDEAGACYEKALQCVDLLLSNELRLSDRHKETKIALLNNLAECLLRLERWREAEGRAGEVIELDSDNEKALWRRGKARRQLHEVAGCKGDFEQLIRLKPSMREQTSVELAQLEASIKRRDCALKANLKNMF